MDVELEFGNFTIPVKTEKVARGKSLPSFKRGCPECGGNVGNVKTCKECGCEPSTTKKKWNDGEEDHLFEKSNIRELKKQAGEDGKLEKVTDLDEIDFKQRGKKPYYLQPEEDAERKYALLNEALYRTEKALIVKMIPRSRQGLYAIWSNGDGLIATKIAFKDSMRHQEPVETEVKDKNVEKFEKLLKQKQVNTEHKIVENRQKQEMEDMLMKKAMGEKIQIEEKVEEQEEKSLEAELEQAIEVEN